MIKSAQTKSEFSIWGLITGDLQYRMVRLTMFEELNTHTHC